MPFSPPQYRRQPGGAGCYIQFVSSRSAALDFLGDGCNTFTPGVARDVDASVSVAHSTEQWEEPRQIHRAA
jgi:hypothetical protein